ncbi:MAG: ferredoxin [Acidobacteriota bacterium]
MADKDSRWPNNAKGRYYVDRSCISAKFCVATAPQLFAIDAGGNAIVIRQPQTPEEEELARDAMHGCPVGAIGDDGEN